MMWAAFLRCGECVRAEGAAGTREAFVLLNHCLDLAEAADDNTQQLLSYSDFGITAVLKYFVELKYLRG